MAGCLKNFLRRASCNDSLSDLVRQRVCTLALCNEDLNDHRE